MSSSVAGGTLTVAIFDELSGWALPERHHARLRELAGDAWSLRAVTTRHELQSVMGETVGLIGMPLTEEQIRQHTGRLRFVQLARSSGDASPAVETAINEGVRVASAGTPLSPQVAEHAIALALALFRRLDVAIARQREHDWAAKELAPQMRSLDGATIGVVGAPPFVRALGRRARGFDARIVACVVGVTASDRVLDGEADEVRPIEDLHDVLASSDVVVVGSPRVPSTMGLVGKKPINAMKKSAVLVDVSKGGIVDHGALVEALRRGRLAGAALDVFETEPLPQTSPFWTMPSVLMTPHVAAAGERFWERLVEQAGENARRLVAGEALIDELAPALYGEL